MARLVHHRKVRFGIIGGRIGGGIIDGILWWPADKPKTRMSNGIYRQCQNLLTSDKAIRVETFSDLL